MFYFFMQELRNQARLYSPDIRQIDLDVNRTYRDHIMFRDRYGTKYADFITFKCMLPVGVNVYYLENFRKKM